MEGRFEEVITSRQRLREIIGDPAPAIVAKVVDQIDEICRHFIAASTFAVIATKAADGLIDVSPKGDPAGFATVLDEKTLVIPDRLGNKRVDSFENLLVNPEVGTIFFIPGYSYTLRVSGHGSIVRDESVAEPTRGQWQVTGVGARCGGRRGLYALRQIDRPFQILAPGGMAQYRKCSFACRGDGYPWQTCQEHAGNADNRRQQLR